MRLSPFFECKKSFCWRSPFIAYCNSTSTISMICFVFRVITSTNNVLMCFIDFRSTFPCGITMFGTPIDNTVSTQTTTRAFHSTSQLSTSCNCRCSTITKTNPLCFAIWRIFRISFLNNQSAKSFANHVVYCIHGFSAFIIFSHNSFSHPFRYIIYISKFYSTNHE